eukprot:TRINITY_DN8233_c0_g3_i1.p1 TRINITY_DN8233_c0_g3~~TRINITY_DN8233_c0_g3_i1.p1  ORF type:complete len:187 (+),score=43.06 TRINITY_DN8233_c0_g3_i1:121-681(+)
MGVEIANPSEMCQRQKQQKQQQVLSLICSGTELASGGQDIISLGQENSRDTDSFRSFFWYIGNVRDGDDGDSEMAVAVIAMMIMMMTTTMVKLSATKTVLAPALSILQRWLLHRLCAESLPSPSTRVGCQSSFCLPAYCSDSSCILLPTNFSPSSMRMTGSETAITTIHSLRLRGTIPKTLAKKGT